MYIYAVILHACRKALRRHPRADGGVAMGANYIYIYIYIYNKHVIHKTTIYIYIYIYIHNIHYLSYNKHIIHIYIYIERERYRHTYIPENLFAEGRGCSGIIMSI